jgi:hypothetical protein
VSLLNGDSNVQLLAMRYKFVPSKRGAYEQSGLNMAFIDGIVYHFGTSPDVILPHFTFERTGRHSELYKIHL